MRAYMNDGVPKRAKSRLRSVDRHPSKRCSFLVLVRFPGTPKAFDARVALLAGLAAATRLRSQGPGLGRRLDPDSGEKSPPPGPGKPAPHEGVQTRNGTSDPASGLEFGAEIGPWTDEGAAAERAERAEKTAEAVVVATSKCKGLARTQASWGRRLFARVNEGSVASYQRLAPHSHARTRVGLVLADVRPGAVQEMVNVA